MKAPSPDFFELLKTMFKHEVDFIIVGGVSAVLHGAPVTTFDLDLLHSRAPDNSLNYSNSLRSSGLIPRPLRRGSSLC